MIMDSHNDYFIQVKKNQKKLYQEVEQIFESEITQRHNSCNPKDIATTQEINKGREEIRVCYTAHFTNPEWKGLQTIAMIQSLTKGKVKNKLTGKTTIEEKLSQQYFISSQKQSADYYLVTHFC